MQKRKARDEIISAVAADRIAAYKKRWQLKQRVSFRTAEAVPAHSRKGFEEELSHWYYVAVCIARRANADWSQRRITRGTVNLPENQKAANMDPCKYESCGWRDAYEC